MNKSTVLLNVVIHTYTTSQAQYDLYIAEHYNNSSISVRSFRLVLEVNFVHIQYGLYCVTVPFSKSLVIYLAKELTIQ
jgi:hypothetical protein